MWLYHIALVALSILLFPLVLAIVLTCPWSQRVRKSYVDVLLKIFEFCTKRLDADKKKNELKLNKVANGSVSTPCEVDGETNGHAIIKSSAIKDDLVLLPNAAEQSSSSSKMVPFDEEKRDFVLSDVLDYMKAGVEAIIEDEVTQRFEAEELKSWNLLTRTNRKYEFISRRITFYWIVGFFIRYCLLLPVRVLICFVAVIWLTLCTGLTGCLPEGPMKRKIYEKVSIWCFNFLSCALSSVITFHNRENIPEGGICVANHTTPVDVMVLHCDNAYALIGQRHFGFLGVIERALGRASAHIWFERSEVKDRETVVKRLKEHVDNPDKLPILIFPEGTCINNTSVMQFKKGSFEVGGVVYPVAIKYDARFTDAFWNSSRHSMIQYLLMMMSSWALVCDVWYLPPMTRRASETAIDFANRVKAVIAKQGGLIDLAWDGQLKRMAAKKEWKQKQQEEYSKRLKAE